MMIFAKIMPVITAGRVCDKSVAAVTAATLEKTFLTSCQISPILLSGTGNLDIVNVASFIVRIGVDKESYLEAGVIICASAAGPVF